MDEQNRTADMRQIDILRIAENRSKSARIDMTQEERVAFKIGYANGMQDMQTRLKHSAEYAFCKASCGCEPWNCERMADEEDCKPLSKFISLMMYVKKREAQ